MLNEFKQKIILDAGGFPWVIIDGEEYGGLVNVQSFLQKVWSQAKNNELNINKGIETMLRRG